MKTFVINIIGPDRPGIVRQISALLKQHQGSWQGSSLSRLAGQFAGIIEVQLPESDYAALSQQLGTISDLHIHTVEAADESPLLDEPVVLRVTANDRPGIIDELSQAIERCGANILHLESWCASAPNWGSALFVAELEIVLPEQLDHDGLRAQIEQLADDLVVDFDIDND